ncbi:TPA: hypothetical protein ACH3X3_011080 [Trebouxia sp. C0006]
MPSAPASLLAKEKALLADEKAREQVREKELLQMRAAAGAGTRAKWPKRHIEAAHGCYARQHEFSTSGEEVDSREITAGHTYRQAWPTGLLKVIGCKLHEPRNIVLSSWRNALTTGIGLLCQKDQMHFRPSALLVWRSGAEHNAPGKLYNTGTTPVRKRSIHCPKLCMTLCQLGIHLRFRPILKCQ